MLGFGASRTFGEQSDQIKMHRRTVFIISCMVILHFLSTIDINQSTESIDMTIALKCYRANVAQFLSKSTVDVPIIFFSC